MPASKFPNEANINHKEGFEIEKEFDSKTYHYRRDGGTRICDDVSPQSAGSCYWRIRSFG